MNNKDLLDAIDELDTKYVTAAWENTQPPEQRAFHIGGAPKKSVGKIISSVSCAAAAIAAVFLTARFIPRIGRSNAPAVGGVTTVESSEPETYNSPASSGTPGTSVPPDTSAEPETSTIGAPSALKDPILYAPDGAQLDYRSENEHIFIQYERAFTRITYDNFAYLARPMNNYNNIEQPKFYTYNGIDNTMRRLYDVIPEYKRFLVGDRYEDLTVKKAETTFVKLNDTTEVSDDWMLRKDGASYIDHMSVEFDGITKIDAIIIPTKDIGSGYFAVPLCSETNIPAVCPIYANNSEEYYNTIRTAGISDENRRSEIMSDYDVKVELNNPWDFSLPEIMSENGVAVATLALSDITAEYNQSNNSSIKATIVDMDINFFVEGIQNRYYNHSSEVDETIASYNNVMYGYNPNAEKTPEDLGIIAVAELREDDEEAKLLLDKCCDPINRDPNPDYAYLLRDFKVELRNGFFYYYRMAYDPETELWTVVKAATFNGTELGR